MTPSKGGPDRGLRYRRPRHGQRGDPLNLIRVMPAKGTDISFARHTGSPFVASHGRSSSWTPSSPTPKVTTGPLPASQKIYVTPDAAPDLSVPLREITLASPTEPKVRVYDTTGPYTDPTIAIDVRKGLARTRRAWVLQRGGVEEYDGRPIQPIDNGNVKATALQPFPNTPRPLRGLDGHRSRNTNGPAPASSPRR